MRIPTSIACPSIPTGSPIASAESGVAVPFVLTLWTADPVLARRADAAGVDRIGVDLETLGKQERQHGRGTWISPHTLADLAALPLSRAQRFARTNPLHAGSAAEIDAVIAHGAQVLMQPMTMTAAQAHAYVQRVRGRAAVVLLVEHVDALARLHEIVRVPGIDGIHIGLNDLALSLGLRNRWLAVADDRVADAGAIVRAAGLQFGMGGIGRVGDCTLPVPSDLVYAEYARTGATSALIARSFLQDLGALDVEIARTRAALAAWQRCSAAELAAAHAELARCAARADGW